MAKIINCATQQPVQPQVGYVDGYVIAERLLEGVMFKITMENGQPVCKGVVDGDRDYMAKFSAKQIEEWCSQAVESASESMTDSSGNELEFDILADPVSAPTPKTVPVFTFEQVEEQIRAATGLEPDLDDHQRSKLARELGSLLLSTTLFLHPETDEDGTRHVIELSFEDRAEAEKLFDILETLAGPA